MKNENKSLLILWLFMFGIGWIVCQVFFSLYKTNADFVKNTSTTQATIITSVKKDSKIIPIYEYTIKYQISGKNFNGTIDSFFNYKDKTTMAIFYENNNPSWIMEQKANWRHLVLFLISLLFPLYALFHIFIYGIRIIIIKLIIRKNSYVIADIVKIKNNFRTKENDWFPYYLECKYQDTLYDSYGITSKQLQYIKENNINQIKLYFSNKDRYYVDTSSIYEKKEG